MATEAKFLAFDLGAESGRGVIAFLTVKKFASKMHTAFRTSP